MIIFSSSKVAAMLLPRLKDFRPDLLIISAGFDAHYDDFYHFLTEDDIHWITDEMCSIVDNNSGYGVVSVLEGGYSLSSPLTSTITGKFSKSVTDSYGTRGKKKPIPEKDEATAIPAVNVDATNMFSQQPGDGGLVKG